MAVVNPVDPDSIVTSRPRRLTLRGLPLSLVIGGFIVGSVLLLAVFGPLLAPHPPNQFNYDSTLAGPSRDFLAGTDAFGRDVLSRVLVGTRLTLAYGLGCALISIVLGTPIGLIAGLRGGRVDEISMRTLDVLMSLPPLMLGLLILAMTTPAVWKAILAIGLISTPGVARVVRSATLAQRREEFIQAAEARGESDRFIAFREVLPNLWPLVTVEAGLQFTFGILLGASLSFLGLGAQPPASDWGLMISEARPLVTVAPWMAIYPAIFMFITVMGFNLLGDGLQELLDPKREGGR